MMEIILALGGIFLFLANLLYLFRVELGARVLFALFRVIIVWEITIPHTLLMPFYYYLFVVLVDFFVLVLILLITHLVRVAVFSFL